MTRHSYLERDYTFGQTMLKLRTSIGLTQVGLADLLGVSRRAIGEWEGGLNYPKAEHFKHFLVLCVQKHVFAPEREEEEIRPLWKTAHQRMLLDEAWLHDLLAPPAPIQLSPQVETSVAHAEAEPAASLRTGWLGALEVSHFAGRDVSSCLDRPSGQRQGKPEGRALTRNTLDPHLPVVLLDDSPGDG
jgi:transcriptional regulator with XRE-family HTH domain